jgi:hypothetical protein
MMSPDNVAPVGPPGSDATVTAEAIEAAGGALADLSNVEAAAGRAALGAQSNDVAFLGRFGRLANGTEVGPGSVPDIGGDWRWHHLGAAVRPVIENGALRAKNGSTYYLGGPVGEPIKSMAVQLEWRPSLNFPGGTNNGGFTIGLAPSAMLDEDGGEVTLPQNMLHIRTDRNGIAGFEIGNGGVNWDSVMAEGATTNGVYWGPTNQHRMQFNRMYTLLVELDTEAHECRVTALGKTWRFIDPQIGASGPYTDFYIEAEGDTQGAAAYDAYCAVHNLWVNAPQLDQTPGFGVMPYNEALASLSASDIVQYTAKQLKLPGYLTGTVYGEAASDRLVVGGNALVSGRLSIYPIAGHGRYQVPMVLQTLANTFVYGANATGGSGAAIASKAALSDAEMLQYIDLALPTNGDSITCELRGYFGANANTKRLKIDSITLGNWFDSGALTESGTPFKLTFTRTKITGTSHVLQGELETSANRVIQRSSHNYGSASNSVLRVTGAAAGDITVDSIKAVYSPAGS